MQKRRHYGRHVLVLMVSASWIVGLIGLDGSRRPRMELVAAAGIVLLMHKAVSAARRRRNEIEPPLRSARPITSNPRSCVVIRLGETPH